MVPFLINRTQASFSLEFPLIGFPLGSQVRPGGGGQELPFTEVYEEKVSLALLSIERLPCMQLVECVQSRR